jgi:iron complex outermembrane receptor protein
LEKQAVKKFTRTVFCLAGLSMPLAALCNEPSIIVTATRSEQERIYLPAAVTVISREELIASGVAHLAEALRMRGGVELSDLYGDGSRVSIGMRGFGESSNANTLVLVDGRRLNNPDMADPDLNSVSLQDVERVEIIQGSGSILYGDQAVGGVINIITRKPDEFTFDASVLTGSYGRQMLRAYAADAFDNGFAFRVSGESRQSDNYRKHNEVEYSNVSARLDYAYGDNNAFLEMQSVTDEQQNPGALFRGEMEADRRQSMPEFANDFNKLEHRISRAGLEQALSSHWELLAEYTDRDSDGEFVLSFSGAAAPAEPPNRQDRELKSFTPRLAGRYDTAKGPLLITLGTDREETGYFLESPFGTQRSDQQTRSFYGQAILPVLDAVDLALGLRRAEVENTLVDRPLGFFGPIDGVPDDVDLDDDLSVYSVGLAVEASDSLRHFIRYEENYRFPKVDEHTQSPVVPDSLGQSGDPLATQTGESVEVGMDWQRDGHSAALALYRLDLENEISFDPVLFQNVNIASTRREGVVISANRQLAAGIAIGANYSYLDTEIRAGSFAGKRVPFTAQNTAGAHLDWRLNEHWHFYTEMLYTGDRLFSGDFAAELPELKGYTVANAQLGFSDGAWRVSLRANNVADREYSGSGAAVSVFPPPDFIPVAVESFYPAPLRNVWLQLSYRAD